MSFGDAFGHNPGEYSTRTETQVSWSGPSGSMRVSSRPSEPPPLLHYGPPIANPVGHARGTPYSFQYRFCPNGEVGGYFRDRPQFMHYQQPISSSAFTQGPSYMGNHPQEVSVNNYQQRYPGFIQTGYPLEYVDNCQPLQHNLREFPQTFQPAMQGYGNFARPDYTMVPNVAPHVPPEARNGPDVAVMRFHFPTFKPGKDAWPVYRAALNVALARQGITTSWQKRDAFLLTFDTDLRNPVAAGISPMEIDSSYCTYEFLCSFFEHRFDSGLTESQAEREFDNCLQGNLPFDTWVEKLNSLVLRCGWGPMTDRALRKQIIKGCNNAEARAELVRRSPRTAANAIQLYRQFMASLKDIESVNRAHELERCAAESKPTVLAVQSPNGIGFREDTQQQNNRSFRNRRNPHGVARGRTIGLVKRGGGASPSLIP